MIGVPAEFNDVQRRAVVEAGEIAGLRMADLINEPAAAALAYMEDSSAMPAASVQTGHQNLLVFDLGGYTFESTVIRRDARSFVMLATARENALGGHDWDMRLVEHVAKIFMETHGVDPRERPGSPGSTSGQMQPKPRSPGQPQCREVVTHTLGRSCGRHD